MHPDVTAPWMGYHSRVTSLVAAAREVLLNLTYPNREGDDEENDGTSKILPDVNSPSSPSDVMAGHDMD